MIGHTVTTPEPQQEIKIKTVLDLQLSHIRNEINTTYTDSFLTIKNSKRADKMWETRNITKEPVISQEKKNKYQVIADMKGRGIADMKGRNGMRI